MERASFPRRLCTALVLAALLPAGSAAAEDSTNVWLQEVTLGLLAHDVDGMWSGSRAEGSMDVHAGLVFRRPEWSVASGVVRPYVGLSLSTRGDTSKFYAGGLWQYRSDSGWFVQLGLGAAIHNGERESDDPDEKELGSRLLFHIPIEVGRIIGGHHRVSIYFDHVSNAGLAHENEGLDTLGVRWSYAF